MPVLALLALLALLVLPPTARSAARQPDALRAKPLVIGHRGASGYRPEHTLGAYELAARMGADYIEPDLVATKDGVLVTRHENDITGTTNVAEHPEFASRRTTKVIDGRSVAGWFTEDFTLAELQSLRAVERLPDLRQQNTIYDGRFRIPTFRQVLALRARLSKELGRDIGVYPETKHPTYFQSIKLPLEVPLLAELKRAKLNRLGAKVFVQSFETKNLKALRRQLRVPLVQLLDSSSLVIPDGSGRSYGELATPSGLEAISRYADGVGPSKEYIVPRDPQGRSLAPTSFVREAHAAGLEVHPYTFRAENSFLAQELRSGTDPASYGNVLRELEQFLALGVDGVFTDNPDIGVAARR